MTRTSPATRSFTPSRFVQRATHAGLTLLALAVFGCVSDGPSGSSSSNWVHCADDPDCAQFGSDARCSSQAICVDAQAEPIPKSTQRRLDRARAEHGPVRATDASASLAVDAGASPGVDAGIQSSQSECIVNGPWRPTHPPQPEDGLVARSPEGAVFAVDQVEGEWIIWFSQAGHLIPRQATTDSAGQAIILTAWPEKMVLRVSPRVDPSSIALLEDEGSTSEPSDFEGETLLEIVDASALEGLVVDPVEIPAEILFMGGSTGDLLLTDQQGASFVPGELLIVGPRWPWNEQYFRVFFGTELPLAERRIESIVNPPDPDVWLIAEFWVGDQLARFEQGQENTLSLGDRTYSLPNRSAGPRAMVERPCTCDDTIGYDYVPVNRAPVALPPEQCNEPKASKVRASPLVLDGDDYAPFDFVAEVVGVGSGALPEAAEFDCAVDASTETCPSNWIQFDRGSDDFWLFIDAPGYAAPVTVGEQVRVTGTWSDRLVGGPHWSVGIESDGELRAWFRRGYFIDRDVVPAGFEITEGAELCVASVYECTLDRTDYALSVKAPDEPIIEIAVGKTQQVGKWSFSNLAFSDGRGDPVPSCSAEPYYGEVDVTLWRN